MKHIWNEITNENREYIKLVTFICSLVLVLILGFVLMGTCMETILRYYLLVLLLGVSTLPFTMIMFRKFRDGGYLFSKILGLLFSGYLLWLFSSLHILRFSLLACFLCVAIVTIFTYGIVLCGLGNQGRTGFITSLKTKWFSIGMSEVFFLLLFLLFLFVLGHKIPGIETEKSMDYAFMSTMMRTDYMPPVDMWAAGKTLNYYYFGQYIMTFLTKISCVGVENGYTLSLSLIAAFCFVLVSSLVYEIAGSLCRDTKVREYRAWVAALLSSVAVTLSGNMHSFIFSKVIPALWDMMKIPGDKPAYWFADSTRYIGYTPDVVGDKTISEFPYYSFIIGDLHAHVIDLIVVITILALLYAYYSRERIVNDNKELCLKEIFCPQLLLIGFLIGICCMTNYWDYPIYFVVSGSIVLAYNIYLYGIRFRMLYTTAAQGAAIYIIAKLISLPFAIKFDQMIMGIALCTTHSRFYQLCILWGFPVAMVAALIITVFRERKKARYSSDLFIILAGLCASGLVILPELIYMRDIYYEGFPRANTMFKLTYEAFVLFGISMGYIIFRFLFLPGEKKHKKGGAIGLVCLILTTGYFFTASKMWLGDYWKISTFQGIDATQYFKENMSDDVAAAKWITDHIKGQPVILEADGDSYTNYERISVLTGMPTVLGWHTHEWLWRNGYDFVEERQNDVTEIYTGTSMENKKALMEQYDVSYIYIGTKEYEKYPDMDVALLEELGEVVYRKSESQSLNMTEIIKVK